MSQNREGAKFYYGVYVFLMQAKKTAQRELCGETDYGLGIAALSPQPQT